MLVAGCQTWGPTWSELSGDRYTRIDPDRQSAILIRAGDESIGTVTPYKVAPGSYRVVVQAPPWRGFTGSENTRCSISRRASVITSTRNSTIG